MSQPRKDDDYSGTKNVTIKGDALRELHRVQDKLTTQLGFRPGLTETIQYLAHYFNSDGGTK